MTDASPGAAPDDLGDRAVQLTEEVAGLRREVAQLNRRQDSTDRRGVRTWYALIGLLALLLIVGGLVYQGQQTAGRLESVVQRALCPVFALVIGGYDPNTRPLGPAREAYEANHLVMVGAYNELRCTNVPVPPRQDR